MRIIELDGGALVDACAPCGEPLDDEIGEFYDPASDDGKHYVAHVDCALARGWEMA